MRNKLRIAFAGLLVAASLAFAPAAFARSHWNVGINLGFPGVSLGYSSGCRHCGWGGNYVYGGYYGGYSGYYAPAYYGPVYRPVYYDYPTYYSPVYYSAPVRRVYRTTTRYYETDRYYDRDRAYDRGYNGRRATYYDRGYYSR